MATHKVNLDALIVREDFAATEESGTVRSREPIFKIEELRSDRIYFSLLRKPDFQRTTDNWDADAIVDCVKSYLDDELVPALIIWHSSESGKVFVIDGAHRFSALIAWANDDYGDGEISRKFYNHDIPRPQRTLHNKTKELIEREIGSFTELMHLALHGTASDDQTKIRRGRFIATMQPDMQKVTGGAEKAQRAFLKINSNPAIIDSTELSVIKARHKPNAIATRALIRAGKGHKYWKFPDDNKTEAVEKIAKLTHTLLFGEIEDMGILTPDVPRAGQPYSSEAFKMILDMVNIFNDITDAMWQEPKRKSAKASTVTLLQDDTEGTETLQFLERVNKAGKRIASNKDGSLGFDPAVYSYGATGKFHTAAFLAALKFAEALHRDGRMIPFTTVRGRFEEFLVKHKSFINQLGHSKVVQETLQTRARCPYCEARYAPFARSQDHKLEHEKGGLGNLENLQFTHSYCNNSATRLKEIGLIPKSAISYEKAN